MHGSLYSILSILTRISVIITSAIFRVSPDWPVDIDVGNRRTWEQLPPKLKSLAIFSLAPSRNSYSSDSVCGNVNVLDHLAVQAGLLG